MCTLIGTTKPTSKKEHPVKGTVIPFCYLMVLQTLAKIVVFILKIAFIAKTWGR